MLRRLAAATAASAALLAAASSIACSGGSGASRTPSPVAGTVPAGPTATAVPDAIRRLDLQGAAVVQQLVRDTGGQFVPRDVIYADVTGDGIEEAIVPIASGGSQGDLAVIVLAPGDGGATTVLASIRPSSAGGITAEVADGKLVTTEPRPGPDDPECCPSTLQRTTYAWDGSKLAIASTVDVPNPGGGGKITPSPRGATPPA